MTTPTSSPPSRWPRLFPKQFGLRALLLLVTICAITAAWMVWAPSGYVAESRLNDVARGMTKQEVSSRLGKPLSSAGQNGLDVWEYRVKNTYPWDRRAGFFMVMFGQDGKVMQVLIAHEPNP